METPKNASTKEKAESKSCADKTSENLQMFDKNANINVYFLDPWHILPFAWPCLIKIMKVTRVASFIPKSDLPNELLEIKDIKLTMAWDKSKDQKKFADSLVYCLMMHMQKHIQIEEYEDEVEKKLEKERRNPFNKVATNNLNQNASNYLILLDCESFIDEYYYAEGFAEINFCSNTFVKNASRDNLRYEDISLHVTTFLKNLLNKRSYSNVYENRVCYILINEYFCLNKIFDFDENCWGRVSSDFVNDIKSRLSSTYSCLPIDKKSRIKKLPTIISEEARDLWENLTTELTNFNDAVEERKNETDWSSSDDFDIEKENRRFWIECGERPDGPLW